MAHKFLCCKCWWSFTKNAKRLVLGSKLATQNMYLLLKYFMNIYKNKE